MGPTIRGTTAVEITSGLHWYLKYWCGAHISWDKTGGIQIASIPKPGALPRILNDEGVIIKRPVPWNYYQNVVTSSYSYVWWNWERWEKEIDWMALQGVNLPLAFTAQETIWQKVFTGFNISKQELDDFFGGPAFLAWARMGNLHGDTFNENSPPTNDPDFISSLGSAVYKAMSKADKDAVWLMQGWLFYSDSSFWQPPQMKEWLKNYSSRRYGKAVSEVEEAWKILHRTVYNCTDSIADHNIDFIVKLPDWDPSLRTISRTTPKQMQNSYRPHKRRFSYHETTNPLPQSHLWYPTHDVIIALRLFLDAKHALAGSLTYRYDLVDLTRQVLSKYANQVYLDAINAFRVKDTKTFLYQSQRFLQLIKDTEELLAADDNFLLGTWLESAKNLAMNHKERRQYEWNARTQVTMWFDTTKSVQSSLHDYANKFWSGLLGKYYLPRASMYFDHLSRNLTENEDFKLKEWRREWIAYSSKWQRSNELYPVKAEGDALAISSTLYDKYLV
uniref:Alpha-N-acetylglucosaminidase C-terminal domain-containing protein n=1 Tax=Daucus carota subsp. sativus TaxID=79200 RepID=A0A166HZ55_DAUCS